ncbi:hypothetical protein FACS1894181_10680 [Bacteroidia bacterium]|nr:hypothetical protein FACS1894181_10680 [Bacteroidia bacterium]
MKERFEKKLLVEGNNDKHVILALCNKDKIPETFDIINCEGIDNLKEDLQVRLKSTIKAIGIVIDADTNMDARWNNIKAILCTCGFAIPDKLPESGLAVYSDSIEKTVGVWIMPDNRSKGMLEDFLVPSDDKLLPIVDSTLEMIEERKLNQYRPVHKPKARIHTWLAWQEDPGTPLGLAITKKYLTADSATCRLFVDWLRKVFEDSPL